jgi:hypothetical protein
MIVKVPMQLITGSTPIDRKIFVSAKKADAAEPGSNVSIMALLPAS